MSHFDPDGEYSRRRASRTVRGVRGFLIHPDSAEIVGFWGGAWSPGVNVATCRESPLKGVPGGEKLVPPGFHLTPTKFGTEHETPGEGCECGVYSYHRIPRPDEQFSFAQQAQQADLLGVVEGWGTILIGDRGWRASRAQILALAPNWGAPHLQPKLPLLGHLSDQYKVPMLQDRDQLLAAFPLSTAFGIPSAA